MPANDFTPGLPIYQQITQTIRQRIASGEWPPGMRISPVREFSIEFGVNPNTAQRSLMELEREGLVYTERTSGRYITCDNDRIRRLQSQMAAEYALQFYRQMRAIGLDAESIEQHLRKTASYEEGGAVYPAQPG